MHFLRNRIVDDARQEFHRQERTAMTSPANLPLATATAGFLAVIALSGCATTTMGASVERGEARLAEMLAGRTAGEPQSCISAYASSRLKVIDETAVVYDAGDTIYVARPDNPRSLDTKDVLVIERTGGQLCKQDVVRTVDRTLGFNTGVVFLSDFVPYR
ncbi:hypothetical protein [Croceicoccus pelagius]|uniref:Uncharacterized protein n=1 Tax=Croceicoccus pelagius TaxID=1703341 RepID=A0A916YKH2_9SPHN|nr:hypothetical protein [Croceicoccus pelagius]GGD48021.1 hypothetical protein GCM10010989_22950 [Croceicoccus pelagius]